LPEQKVVGPIATMLATGLAYKVTITDFDVSLQELEFVITTEYDPVLSLPDMNL